MADTHLPYNRAVLAVSVINVRTQSMLYNQMKYYNIKYLLVKHQCGNCLQYL